MKFKKLAKKITKIMNGLANDNFDGSVKVELDSSETSAIVTVYDEDNEELARCTIEEGPEVEDQKLIRVRIDEGPDVDKDGDDEDNEIIMSACPGALLGALFYDR